MFLAATQTESRTDDRIEEANLALSAQHDPDAFIDLYRRYVDAVFRYCYRRLESVESAEDATSQVFERALRSIHQYRGGSFRAWLFRIAYTTIVDTWKRRQPIASGVDPDQTDPDQTDPDPTPEQRALQRESGQNVQQLLEKLSEEQARVVELRLAGLKGPEIAEAMNRTPESVRMLQYQAMERLRTHLDTDDHAEASNDPR